MQKMMKQLGISVDELPDVEEIIIKTATKDYVFGSDASVTVMDARGQKTYQIMGEPKVILKEDKSGIPQEDVELVAAQAGVSEAEARKALEECDGNPAEAILKLTS
jgi:nascent polypeptide-associated complex subunit alpha